MTFTSENLDLIARELNCSRGRALELSMRLPMTCNQVIRQAKSNAYGNKFWGNK